MRVNLRADIAKVRTRRGRRLIDLIQLRRSPALRRPGADEAHEERRTIYEGKRVPGIEHGRKEHRRHRQNDWDVKRQPARIIREADPETKGRYPCRVQSDHHGYVHKGNRSDAIEYTSGKITYSVERSGVRQHQIASPMVGIPDADASLGHSRWRQKTDDGSNGGLYVCPRMSQSLFGPHARILPPLRFRSVVDKVILDGSAQRGL